MSGLFGSSGIFSKGIRDFTDAIAKGTSDFTDNIGSSFTAGFGTTLSNKLKQAASAARLGNTLNDVVNESRRKALRGCVSFEKEWIEDKVVEAALKDELDGLYGGSVISSLSTSSEKEEPYPFGDAPTVEEASATCLLALKTLGNRGGGCTPAFQMYLQRVLNLSQSKFLDVQSKLSTIFMLDTQLLTIIVDEIKEPVVSFPTAVVYCMAGVVVSKDQDVSNTTLTELQKHGHVKDIVKTKLHYSSADSWKEKIELCFFGQECVVLMELWEASKHSVPEVEHSAGRVSLHYSDTKKKKKVKKSGGFDTDVLIGSAAIKVVNSKQQNSSFKSTTFELCKGPHHSLKSKGKVKYFLDITSKQFKLSVDEAMLQHKLLCNSIMACDSLDSNKQHMRSWNGSLSTEGTHLLRLHALQTDLTEVQQLIIQVVGLTKYLEWYLVDICSLLNMVDQLLSIDNQFGVVGSSEFTDHPYDEPDKSSCLSRLATDCPDAHWIVELIDAFDKFVQYYEDVLTNHIFYFKPTDLQSLHNHIRLLKLICTFEAFASRPGCSISNYRNRAEECMKKGCKKWYDYVYSTAVPIGSSEDDKLSAFCDVLDHINIFLKEHLVKFNEVFKSYELTDVKYAELMYYTLDEFIYDRMDDLILNEAEIGTSCTYHLFTSIRTFCHFSNSLAKDYSVELKCSTFPEWFEPFVKDWIDDIIHTVKQEILVIFENCNFEETSKQLETPAADEEFKECSALVSDCTLELKKLYSQLSLYWSQLKWPVPVEDFFFAHRFVKGICQLITFYANKTEQNAISINFFAEKDGTNNYALNRQIYFSLNSLDVCLEILKILPPEFDLNRCICNLDLEGTEVTQEQAQESLDAVVNASKEDIEKKLETMFANIEAKLKPDLTRLIEELFVSMVGSSAEDASCLLCNFLSEIIDDYRNVLLTTMHKRILKFLWDLLCRTIDNIIVSLSAAKQRPPTSVGEVLQIFTAYFYLSGNGLSRDDLESSVYMSLQGKVDCKAKSTTELAALYFTSFADKLKEVSREMGLVHVNVTYSRVESYLLIAVVSCELKAIDSAGLPDPYVEVHLLPPGDAMKKTLIKTEVVKKSLTPLFKRQVYEMTIPQEAYLDEVGTSVVFLVKSRSKVLGMSLIPCKEISRYGVRGKRSNSPKVDRRFDDETNQKLSLIDPACGDLEALNELKYRANVGQDGLAKQIIKIMHED